MKWRLSIRPRAESDLREARDWYESQRRGLGGEFVAEIEVGLQALVRDPERYTVYYRGFRRAGFHTSCFTDSNTSESLYFAFSMRAVIILSFFDLRIHEQDG